jgi:hypothetical protein
VIHETHTCPQSVARRTMICDTHYRLQSLIFVLACAKPKLHNTQYAIHTSPHIDQRMGTTCSIREMHPNTQTDFAQCKLYTTRVFRRRCQCVGTDVACAVTWQGFSRVSSSVTGRSLFEAYACEAEVILGWKLGYVLHANVYMPNMQQTCQDTAHLMARYNTCIPHACENRLVPLYLCDL